MNTFITADLHINHGNIIKYCNRPFKNINHMNDTLIRNINSRCKKEDQLYIAGDVLFSSGLQSNGLVKPKEFFYALNPNVTIIAGNHDLKNSVYSKLKYCVINFAKKDFLICHVPPNSPLWESYHYNFSYVLPHVDCVLCGHVHEKWKHYNHKIKNTNKAIPVINIGVDVWKFRPVKMNEVYNLYLSCITKKN
jgi:calcineurin-like phosphoesterase family protein